MLSGVSWRDIASSAVTCWPLRRLRKRLYFRGRRAGRRFLEGTFELTILEGTGIYKRFAGGHNHMVDRLHFLAPGDGSGGIDEYCFCFISRQ
jgi:hypothetical protein